MRRRLAVLAFTALALTIAVGSAGARAKPTLPSWAAPQIEVVVSAGLMASSSADFRPDDPLTQGELAIVLASLGVPQMSVVELDQPVTMRELDAWLVTALGLRPQARFVRDMVMQAGLAPTPWLGTETIARMLGLRVNHPREQEQLELQIKQPATRAEAAYSIARVLMITEYELDEVRQAADTFVAPWVTDWQQEVLRRALRFVGTPYVWAGTSERPQKLLEGLMPGGFDCSGFAWRVFKLEPYVGAPQLTDVLKGRTSYAMSGEVPRAKRIPFADLQPGDLLFFGSRGSRSRPSEVGHMGIYVGSGWMVHSSDRGVALRPMTGWYETRFAWGRRPLAEAGLS